MACEQCSLGLYKLFTIFSDNNKLLTFLETHKLIKLTKKCGECDNVIQLNENNVFRCDKTVTSNTCGGKANYIPQRNKIRSDEVFRRISLVDLIQLILIYAEENNTEKLAAFDEDVKSLHFKNKIEERESLTLCESNEVPVCPFLILDVRSEAEFNRGHLVTAVSYPHSGLSRAFCWESKIMLLYKNHPEWIIIICDENENLSPGVATTLIHRGYSNSFMLSGGLKLAQDKIGSPLITTDKNQILTSEAAEILCEMLSSTIIPSVGLHGPLDWWTDKSAESVKYDKEQ